MVAVKKPGKLRMYLDPKDLNVTLKRSNYILPRIEEILPWLAEINVFSVLDAKTDFGKSRYMKRAANSSRSGHHLEDIAG